MCDQSGSNTVSLIQVHCLPEVEFGPGTLDSEAEWWRAYVILTFISQAYIWAEGEEGIAGRLPQVLAVPWVTVAEHLGMPPVITYAATVLMNWSLRNPGGPMDNVDNLVAMANFTGTEDESWFYMVAAGVELAAAPGVKAVVRSLLAITEQDNETLTHSLRAVAKSLESMRAAFNRMYERCDPKLFYTRIRPFQAGTKGLDVLPEGLVYEGISQKRKKLSGASAAQSSAIPTFDIFLGARHTGGDAEFLAEMRGHMPSKHREFLEVLQSQPSIREYVRESGSTELISAYNDAVTAFADFRSDHVVLVTRYIVMQKAQYSANVSLKNKGTGGTDFMLFLKSVRDDTLALRIV